MTGSSAVVKPDWEGGEDKGDNWPADPASLISIWSIIEQDLE
jgi:hypothetical protein